LTTTLDKSSLESAPNEISSAKILSSHSFLPMKFQIADFDTHNIQHQVNLHANRALMGKFFQHFSPQRAIKSIKASCAVPTCLGRIDIHLTISL
jgi:uncharacterized lipoprotein YbaY